uniref:TGF-beta-like protein n=1 Tax=Apapanepox virus TaxID=3049969 RepID=A0AAT9UPK4_9POXV
MYHFNNNNCVDLISSETSASNINGDNIIDIYSSIIMTRFTSRSDSGPFPRVKRDFLGVDSICDIRSINIKFSDYGMKWIVSPLSTVLTYCYGICSISSYQKTSLMYGTIITNHMPDNTIPQCCYPITRSNFTIQYRVGRNIKTDVINNFMPLECACG